MAEEELTISQVAQRSGYAASALRFYEDSGLISATRNNAGRRRYTRQVLRRLAFIRAAQNVGLSLEDIKVELQQLPSDRNPTKRDWSRIAKRWQSVLAERVAALQQLAQTLDACIGCGCLSLAACRLYNADDELAEAPGLPGAKRWPAVLRQPPG